MKFGIFTGFCSQMTLKPNSNFGLSYDFWPLVTSEPIFLQSIGQERHFDDRFLWLIFSFKFDLKWSQIWDLTSNDPKFAIWAYFNKFWTNEVSLIILAILWFNLFKLCCLIKYETSILYHSLKVILLCKIIIWVKWSVNF